MKTYNAFVSLIREWANRDEEVLSNTIVTDCMDYAVDKAYRTLRIQALESTVQYSSTELADYTTAEHGRTITELLAPSDLIEYIQIRSVDSNGVTQRVFNEKTDIRTFYDPYAEKYSGLAYWTRIGNTAVLSPGYKENTEESVYLHYYRKLEALNERYEPTVENANLNSSYLVELGVGETAPVDYKTGVAVDTVNLKKAVYTANVNGAVVNVVFYDGSTPDESIPAADVSETLTITQADYYGQLLPNWFRDDNQRVLLYGALSEAFIYLNEPDTAQMYLQMYMSEINALNQDENTKKASGGNIQINVNGYGLI